MNTDDLISMLAKGVEPVDRKAIAKRFSLAVVIGIMGALVFVWLRLGVRADLATVATTPLFWAKMAFPLSLAIGALMMVMRLARPGMSSGYGKLWVGLGVATTWAGALYSLSLAEPGTRMELVLGQTWKVCTFCIAALSIPGFIAIFRVLRGLAPTRPRLAGACGGLLSGALATIAYCLHCPEMGVPFWGVWYLLGMLTPTLVGALLGPRLLRW